MASPKHAFTDRVGRVWLLVMNYGLSKRINAALGVDFANAHTGECLQQLATSDELLVATLFAIVEAQAQAASVSPEQFAEALDGEVFEAAGEALGEMLRLFTRPALRPVIEAAIGFHLESTQAVIDAAAQKLRGPAGQAAIRANVATLECDLDQALTHRSTATSWPTNGPASPASIPAPSACASSTGSPPPATSSSGITAPP